MIGKFARTASLAAVFAAVPPIAFAADEAPGCAAEWARAEPTDGRITQDAFMQACRGDLFKARAPDPGAPLKGNSFTAAQAKDRAVAAGYRDIAPLTKDADGIWRGAARKDADTVNIAIDFKGNVVSQ